MGAYWVEADLVEGGGNATVTVDEGSTFQQWLGFGGTFNEAGWDALAVLDAATRDQAIRLLFSDSEGAGFDWGRIPIGASDYALSRYTLAETPNDLTMESFSIERDRQMLIPYIKAAQAVKPDIRFWGSPWSPPAWMKDSNDINGTDADASGNGATFESHMLSDPSILQAHALYFARFIEEYAAEGIPIDHVHPQNEPGYATRYPSCLWDAGLLGTFVGDYLGPTLQDRGLSTEIWFGTLSNADTYSGHINGLNGSAAQYVTGVGLQWNTISNVGTLSNQGYLVMQTEHKCGNYPWETATFNANQPPNDHAYGEESWGLVKQWLEAGVHIYSAWNMVLDTQGQNLDEQRPWPQNALLAVNRSTSELLVTPTYYVFRHLSQFVDPGATRIGVSGGDAVAFKNPDSSIVTVLYNSGGQDSPTTLAVGGTTVQFTIPARGWATVNWEG
jgi:glucosylceramidase